MDKDTAQAMAMSQLGLLSWCLKIAGICFTALFGILAITIISLRYNKIDGWIIFIILIGLAWKLGWQTYQKFKDAKNPFKNA